VATRPDAVRVALATVTVAAVADVRAVESAAAQDPAVLRAALFAATPLIVSDYGDATSVLALDWFEELREQSPATRPFAPTPRLLVTDDEVSAMVASVTQTMQELTEDVERQIEASMSNLELELQKMVASGFRDTIIGNTDDDPDAAGWQRFARSGACKFCLMLAGRGAVYTEASVSFAAHGGCSCVASPSWDADAPRATVMQYVASKRTRTEAESARLRDYLNKNFPDAPG